MDKCCSCGRGLSELPHWQAALESLVDEHFPNARDHNGVHLQAVVSNILCSVFGLLLRAYGKDVSPADHSCTCHPEEAP